VFHSKIRGISRQSAADFTFEVEPGKKETIERHFMKKYNIKLKAPYLPVIQVTATSYVPMEVASVVVGGTFFGKLSPRMDADLVGEMMKSACKTLLVNFSIGGKLRILHSHHTQTSATSRSY